MTGSKITGKVAFVLMCKKVSGKFEQEVVDGTSEIRFERIMPFDLVLLDRLLYKEFK